MIKIKIDLSIIVLLFMSCFGGLFKELIIFFCIIILHELAHIFTAKIFNVNCQRIYITMIGGFIDLNYYNDLLFFKKLLINTSGILMNMLLILLFKSINFPIIDYNTFVGYNYLMIIINLLPIPPLDGYKITYDILNLIFDEEYTIDCLFYISLILISVIGIILFIFKLYGYYLILSFLLFKTIVNKKNNYHNLLNHGFINRI